jgi:predicted small metal-binding protein
MPSEKNCTLTIAGEEDEVLDAAAQHAASAHGHRDTQELRDQIRKMLKPEESEGWTPAGNIDQSQTLQ